MSVSSLTRNQLQVFSDAWSTVHHALPKPSSLEAQAQAQAQAQSRSPTDLTASAKAISDLAYRWSDASPGFVQFVKELGDLVNDYFAPVMAGEASAGQSAPEALARAEAVWIRVIELETEIWPNPGDEATCLVSKRG